MDLVPQKKSPVKKPLTAREILWRYRYQFTLYVLGFFVVTFLVLYMFGAVPTEFSTVNSEQDKAAGLILDTFTFLESKATVSSSTSMGQFVIGTSSAEFPQKISIPAISVDTIVSNPNTTDNDILNQYLLKGAVRYPGSGIPGQGNMFIFGHNTSVAIVHNQAYKTFNGLKDLKNGDSIYIDSSDIRYTYIVDSVTLVDSSTAWVDLSSHQNILTLSTCDVFGEKQQRFVVVAHFDSSKAL